MAWRHPLTDAESANVEYSAPCGRNVKLHHRAHKGNGLRRAFDATANPDKAAVSCVLLLKTLGHWVHQTSVRPATNVSDMAVMPAFHTSSALHQKYETSATEEGATALHTAQPGRPSAWWELTWHVSSLTDAISATLFCSSHWKYLLQTQKHCIWYCAIN
jgi:hypothetical protein